MSKILSATQMDELRPKATGLPVSPDLEALVAPTADDLMELTLTAFADVEPQLNLGEDQRNALRAALQTRLIAVLTGQVTET